MPSDADAVVLNVTVTDVTAGSFLQLWPTGSTQPPLGSSLNYSAGQTVPNAVTVKLGTDGKVSVFNKLGSTNVIADVAGYYKAGAGGDGFTSVTPASACSTPDRAPATWAASPPSGGPARSAT